MLMRVLPLNPKTPPEVLYTPQEEVKSMSGSHLPSAFFFSHFKAVHEKKNLRAMYWIARKAGCYVLVGIKNTFFSLYPRTSQNPLLTH